jgi:hypothetical protein
VETYTSFQVRDILKIDYTRLQEWIKRGYVVPTIPATGRGTKSKFSRNDLYSIQTFLLLLQRGISREIAAAMVKKSLYGKEIFWNIDIFTYSEKITNYDEDNGTYVSKMSGGVGFDYDTENELFRVQIHLSMIKKIVDSMIMANMS